MTHSFWPLRLLTMLSPDFFGNPAQNNFWGYDNYWENAAYIGVIPILLALYAIWNRLRRKVTQGPIGFLATTALVSLILALGWFTPIYPFLYQTVPGFALFQGPARWLIITLVALCALAGFGMQQVLDQGVSRKATTRLILLGLALSLAGLAASFVLKGRVETFGPATLRLGALLILAGWLFRSDLQKPKWTAALVVVVALDLITAQFALNPTLPPDIYRATNPTAEALKADGSIGRVFFFAQDEEAIKFGKYLAHKTPEGKTQFDGFGPNDLNFWLNERAALLPNAAMIDRVPSANNFDSLIVGRYQTLLDRIEALPLEQALPLLSQMHVGYIVSPRELNLPIVTRTPDVTVYRNDQVLPRAWVAAQDVDLQNVATIMPGSAIESLTDSGNTVTIRASLPQAGWLILSDTFYPGWQAAVDGLPTEIRAANTAFRAVQVPAGVHTIEFRYEPRSVSIGLLVSLVCLVIIIGRVDCLSLARSTAMMKRMRPWHVVLAISLLYVLLTLARYNGDPKYFALIGTRYDPGVPDGRPGYDGQFAYQIARDPANGWTKTDVPAYRYQRIAYPIAARVLALGNADLVPWTLILINLGALVVGTWLTEEILQHFRMSRWYALAYGLSAGTLMSVRLDLTEPLAYALAQAGVLLALKDRWRWAAVVLAVAALTKEMTLAFAGGHRRGVSGAA